MAELRKVRLEEVARYLECNPKKLCIALKHLAAVPSAIQYSKDAAVSINPAFLHIAPVALTAEAAAARLSPEAATRFNRAREEEEDVGAWDKMVYAAIDRLDQAGGKGNYSTVELLAAVDAARTPEQRAWYQAFEPAFNRYRVMKSSEEKWRN